MAFKHLTDPLYDSEITIPVEVVDKLNIKRGDKLLFTEDGNDEIVVKNFSRSMYEPRIELKDTPMNTKEIEDAILKYLGKLALKEHNIKW